MKTGKITAKLRDVVPVCLMVNGEEVKRYKNIEFPDILKSGQYNLLGLRIAFQTNKKSGSRKDSHFLCSPKVPV